MTDRHDARRPVDRGAVVIAVPFVGLARVNAHTRRDRRLGRPALGTKGSLRVDRGQHPVGCGGEGDMHAVTGGLDDRATVRCDRDAQDSSWRASAARIASGCSSQRCVDPSISVNKNVTVPEGVRPTAKV